MESSLCGFCQMAGLEAVVELAKARRMVLLALRHENTRRLFVVLLAAYCGRWLARQRRKRAAADRFMSLLLSREAPLRVQSAVDLTAFSRLKQSTESPHGEVANGMPCTGMPRNSSRALLTTMVQQQMPDHALCSTCFSRCSSNASLVALASAVGSDGGDSSMNNVADTVTLLSRDRFAWDPSVRSSTQDPSAQDPSRRDPSRRDPSRRDPSRWDPSWRDPPRPTALACVAAPSNAQCALCLEEEQGWRRGVHRVVCRSAPNPYLAAAPRTLIWRSDRRRSDPIFGRPPF